MLDICCSLYKHGDTVNGYNAPYKYGVAKRLKQDYSQYLKVWETSSEWVLDDFTNRVGLLFESNSQLIFATPPSRTQIFTQKIRQRLRSSFPMGVDVSDCFSKSEFFSAGSTTIELTNQQLRTFFNLNRECFEMNLPPGVNKVLLADDVYSLGNTLKAMCTLIHDIKPDIEIITAVILKTEL